MANPREMLLRAVEALAEKGVVIETVSPLYSSPAWPPGSDAPDYTNAVMAVRSDAGPAELMSLMLRIEETLGRVRTITNAPRPIDLDLIDFDGCESDDPHVTLPHPRMADRAFVLLPLKDVAPEWRHPDGRGIDALIAAVDCSETVRLGSR